MSVHTESAFESSIEGHLLTHGWSTLAPSGYDRELGLFPDDLLGFIEDSQPQQWQQLVTRLGGERVARARVVQHVAGLLDHRGTVSVLRDAIKLNGVTFRVCFFKPANTLTPALQERYAANRTTVVRQLHHSESAPADSLDVTLVVNGIPTASAELKNTLTHQGVQEAMQQYRTDRNPSDLIFRARTVVHFAVDPHQVYMTTRLARDTTRFLPFNQGSGGAGHKGGAGNPTTAAGYATSYLWEQVWQRDAWLDLLGSFVHTSDIGGERVTLFPRYHQWHAVRSILAATLRDGAGTNRLIQHSAGSGKSNTIAWTAHRLSRLHGGDDTPIFDKVVIITDRVVLDRQLQDTVAGLEHTPGTIVRVDKNSAQLRDALSGHAARIVVTTLQKFPVVAELAADVVGSRFAVLIDEAHSSTSGEAMKKLQEVLSAAEIAAIPSEDLGDPAVDEGVDLGTDVIAHSAAARRAQQNLTYIAFTATPKPKTLNTFGTKIPGAAGERDTYEPFHLYSMRQAIEEGFILDVLANYTTFTTYFKLVSTAPDDPEVPVDKARAEMARFISLHPTNLRAKAEIIVEHFRGKTRGKINGHAKAMVVTRSRLHAVRYKQEIDAYIREKGYDVGPRPLHALVAFSGTLDHQGVTYAEATMNGFKEGELPSRFATDEHHLLVVAEKYQTGFDQPLLHTMYVDKKLANVKAVQTLSRLNRTHPGKTDTFVLDFANTVEEIQDAFAPFFETASALAVDPNDAYTMQHTLMAARILDPDEMDIAVQALLSGHASQQKVVYAQLGRAVERFVARDDHDQQAFRDTLTSYVRAYTFLAQVMTWTDRDLERLYLFGKALLTQLPHAETDPMPLVSDQVELTHLRTALTAEEENAALSEGDDTPGDPLPGAGMGGQDPLVDKLSALVERLNDKFGVGTTDADKVWFEQQRLEIEADDELRVVALHNSRDAFELVLRERVPHHVANRQAENGKMFDLFFNQPRFQQLVLEYLGETYDTFRADTTA
ncbi:type I restriction endonuclease subunit R [Cellulosimicrobium cellulans]|uniref:type I restriction endonuclease subunit R n=1 Tax=Cellulosimicrobium cellulans TaxID=1710 RepID=UPI002406200A|nr:DEAD/DEAH box helicase family protein [Cellulosimicrobium cellulans]MDF9874884.1 type I restriction enzyme R subunit [Cellulosimicrobium cellulans]